VTLFDRHQRLALIGVFVLLTAAYYVFFALAEMLDPRGPETPFVLGLAFLTLVVPFALGVIFRTLYVVLVTPIAYFIGIMAGANDPTYDMGLPYFLFATAIIYWLPMIGAFLLGCVARLLWQDRLKLTHRPSHPSF
jgi:hypothetical protein